jgi:hypothetical protein
VAPRIQKLEEEGKGQLSTATNPHWGFASFQSHAAEGGEEGREVEEEEEGR